MVATEALSTVSAPVRDGGVARANLDVPSTPGTYEVRALVTDPRTGAIRVERRPIVVR